MDRTTSIILSILVIISCSDIAYAAPSPKALAVNPATMECGIFWAGDEFERYSLPEGWKAYAIGTEAIPGECVQGAEGCRGYQCKLNDVPETYCWGSKFLCDRVKCEGYRVETDTGTCYIKETAETCCNQLGYTYKGENIGKREFYLEGKWRSMIFNHPEITVLVIFAFLAFIYLKRRYRMKR